MVATIEDTVLDNGLTVIDANSTHLVLCSGEPTTIAHASVAGNTAGGASVLGWKSFAAGSAFGAIAAGTPTGRKVASTSVGDGTILTTGTANWWAVIVGTTSLQAHGSLSASQVVTSGNTFSMASFDIRIPGKNPDA
jgi:hypothetical protein